MNASYLVTDSVYEDLANRFMFHPAALPEGLQPQGDRYEHLRSMCLVLAREIARQSPPCREQSLAITKLEEVSMWVNAAISRHE